jgi:acetolactate synthase-1/2/3 large subunit
MTMPELGTIAQEHVNVNVAIINNGYLGMVRQWQQFFYEKRYVSTPILSPDYAKVAEAYGLRGTTVRQRADVIPAVQAAREDGKAVIIDFQVEQEDSVYPMVPSGAGLHQMILRDDAENPIVETGDSV